jgi:hypothetical protein
MGEGHMLRNAMTGLMLGPLAVLIVLFAVANRERIVLSLDPFSSGSPLLSTPPVPLCFVVLLPLMAGVIVGGFATFLGQRKWRRLARENDAEVRRLQSELKALTAKATARPGGSALRPGSQVSIGYRPPSAA